MSDSNGQTQPQAADALSDEWRQSVGLMCRNCAYSRPGPAEGLVLCHFNTPQVVAITHLPSAREQLTGKGAGLDIKPVTTWPVLAETEWCGAFASPDEFSQMLVSRFGQEPEQEGANDAG